MLSLHYGICINDIAVLFVSATFFVMIRVIVKAFLSNVTNTLNRQKPNSIIWYIKWISIHILYLTEVSQNKNFTIKVIFSSCKI